MDILFRDMRILRAGTKLLKILYLLRTTLSIGIVVFSALEIGAAIRERKEIMPFGQ